MEKSVMAVDKVASDSMSGINIARNGTQKRESHLKAWKEIYQDVRRQWAEAEGSSTRQGAVGRKTRG